GPLAQLLDKWTVRLGPPHRVRRGGDEWLTLRRADVPLPAFPAGTHLVLTIGDRLPVAASSLALAGERLSFRSAALEGGPARLPVSAVSALWLAAPDDVADAERFRRRLLSERRRHDVVVLRNGDVLEGVLEQLDPGRLRIEVARRGVTVDLAKVAAVAFSSELATALRPRGTYARLVLADGTRLALEAAGCGGGPPGAGEAVVG